MENTTAPLNSPVVKKNKRWLLLGGIVLGVFLIITGILLVIGIKRSNVPVSATITYSQNGFSPASLNLLVDLKGTGVAFANTTNSKLDISENSSNPQVFQVGIIDPKSGRDPRKIILKKPGIYTFTNNKNPAQNAVIHVITTEQVEAQ